MALRARRRQGGGSNFTQPVGSSLPSVGALGGPGAAAQPKPPVKGGRQAPIGAPPVVAPVAKYTPTSPSVGPPPRTAGGEGLRAQAASNLGIAQTQNRDAVYRAIMNLGDPENFAKYGANPEFAGYTFTQDPNSVWASLARQETKGLDTIDKGSLGGNTFFSGKRLQNRTDLSDETSRQRLGASTAYGDDLKALAASLGLAQGQYGGDISSADQMDIDAALEQERISRELAPPAVNPTTGAPIKGGLQPVVGPGPTDSRTLAQRQAAARGFVKAQKKRR